MGFLSAGFGNSASSFATAFGTISMATTFVSAVYWRRMSYRNVSVSSALDPINLCVHIKCWRSSMSNIHTPVSRAATTGSTDFGGPSIILVMNQYVVNFVYIYQKVPRSHLNRAKHSPPMISGSVGLRCSRGCSHEQLRPFTTSAVKLGSPQPGTVNILPPDTCQVARCSWMFCMAENNRAVVSTIL